jgi:queuine tRNA-ribosyltransferase
LGVGKPEDIVFSCSQGYQIFDCVLPTRDARHGRLYRYNADTTAKINVKHKDFYSYYIPHKTIYKNDTSPVSTACDCLLCKNYSRGYLYHLYKLGDPIAFRLASIHNLRFYSLLMEKLTTFKGGSLQDVYSKQNLSIN